MWTLLCWFKYGKQNKNPIYLKLKYVFSIKSNHPPEHQTLFILLPSFYVTSTVYFRFSLKTQHSWHLTCNIRIILSHSSKVPMDDAIYSQSSTYSNAYVSNYVYSFGSLFGLAPKTCKSCFPLGIKSKISSLVRDQNVLAKNNGSCLSAYYAAAADGGETG